MYLITVLPHATLYVLTNYLGCTYLLQAIGSLIELMKLMGPCSITQVKMKVLAILRYRCMDSIFDQHYF